jgi:hypothetical protein
MGAAAAIRRQPKLRCCFGKQQAFAITLEAVALEDADLGHLRFEKVFAFNVAPFWQQPEAPLRAVRDHLARDGAIRAPRSRMSAD